VSTPEQRFEVPPEYAEVYERAYRRAYEEGQGRLGATLLTTPPPRRTGSRGRRVAVPQQRTNRRRVPDQRRPPPRSGEARSATRVDTGKASRPAREQRSARSGRRAARGESRRTGHRAEARFGSTILPLVGLALLMVLLLVGAFLLGRATAGTVSLPRTPLTGGEPGASASGTEGPEGPVTTPAGFASYAGSRNGPS
jgi:hypothetical protein